jgi:hypothetical protein
MNSPSLMAFEASRVCSDFGASGSPQLATIPMVLMSTNDFGNWTRYLPRNPGFM